ncbi:hypothetical protein COOONC_01810 [Cooperia oncophora]
MQICLQCLNESCDGGPSCPGKDVPCVYCVGFDVVNSKTHHRSFCVRPEHYDQFKKQLDDLHEKLKELDRQLPVSTVLESSKEHHKGVIDTSSHNNVVAFGSAGEVFFNFVISEVFTAKPRISKSLTRTEYSFVYDEVLPWETVIDDFRNALLAT